jgi:predicted secreted protein
MAKKKKSADAAEGSKGPTSSAAPATSAAPASAAIPGDTEAAVVDAAFAAGNYQVVRSLARTATSPAAREKAQRLMSKMNIEPQQAMMAGVALLVLLVVAALVLVRA